MTDAKLTAEDVRAIVADRDIRFIRLWFTDVIGQLKSFSINVAELDGALEAGMGFDGSSITGFNAIEESDMIAMPDPSTFAVLPWDNRVARVYDVGVKPLVANEINVTEAFERASGPLRGFMEKNVREKDLRLFVDLSGEKAPDRPEDLSMRILIPAFMISELKRAFEIGFLLFLPFLIIDLVVASVLMSMGMMMLPPVVVSLPFKLIFFVLVDGWTLVAGSLIQSYGT